MKGWDHQGAWHSLVGGLGKSDMALDVGTAAVRLAWGPPHIKELNAPCWERPALSGGVITDPEIAVDLLQSLFRQVRRWGFPRIRALACAPSDATAREKRVLADCTARAGAAAVFICPEPLAAAVGAGIDVGSRYAKLIVDIGEGVTDCAVISAGQIVRSSAVRTGCADFRRSIRRYLIDRYDLAVSQAEAECVLEAIGVCGDECGDAAVAGVGHGRQCQLAISAIDLRAAYAPELDHIFQTLKELVCDLPAPAFTQLLEEGIYLSGGGAMLRGMGDEIARITQIDTHVVRDPLRAVVMGAAAMLPSVSLLALWQEC